MKPLLISLILLTSCSTSWKISHKLKKANKLIKQAEALGAKVGTDTVYKEVTKIVKGDSVRVEIPIWSKVKDTVIYHDRAVLKIIHKHDTVKITAECLPDTVKIEVPVTVHKSIVCPDCPKDKFWKGVGWGAGGLLILLILYGLIKLIK